MKDTIIKELTTHILLLRKRVVEIKGSSIFSEENNVILQPLSKRLQNANIRES